MKRATTRLTPNAPCLMPRNALAWMMVGMAILTILSFISIEVRRILLRTARRDDIQHEEEQHNDSTFWKLPEGEPLCPGRTFLLVLVTSPPRNFEQRDAIRRTWANRARKNPWVEGLRFETVFLVGRSVSRFINVLVQRESELAHDMLLGDYPYRDHESLRRQGLTWALTHCSPAYTLATDGDALFLDGHLLARLLWRTRPRNRLWAGRGLRLIGVELLPDALGEGPRGRHAHRLSLCSFFYVFGVSPARMPKFQDMAERAVAQCDRVGMTTDWS